MTRKAIPAFSLLLLCLQPTAIPLSGASSEPAEAPLGIKISSLRLESVSIVDALRELHAKSPPRAVFFTLEVIPFRESPESNLRLSFARATVGQVLDSIVSQDPRYAYEVIDSRLIHVFPHRAKQDPRDLLNVRVRNLKIPERQYDILLKYPQYFIPELQQEIEHRSGTSGYAGSTMGGVDLPKVGVSLESGTVRDALNRIAQKTEEFAKLPPAGWIYTFRTDESSPLGGHPTWQIF